jgi:DNA-binding response OmpR family regulator
MTILNIDDDSEDLELFCEVMESIDPKIKCLTAQTPDEAFLLLDETKLVPNYIFLDINMPVKDGKECLK